MTPFTRRRLFIAGTLTCLLVAVLAAFVIVGRQNLKARRTQVSVGMTREQVEGILGPPVLVLPRSDGKGHVMVWTDMLWQVDVGVDSNGAVNSCGCVPANSAYRRTEKRLNSLLK